MTNSDTHTPLPAVCFVGPSPMSGSTSSKLELLRVDLDKPSHADLVLVDKIADRLAEILASDRVRVFIEESASHMAGVIVENVHHSGSRYRQSAKLFKIV